MAHGLEPCAVCPVSTDERTEAMSAWIVSKRHIDYMVREILARELSDKSPDDLGRMLWAECLKSVAYRYPDNKDGERPGPISFRDNDVTTYTYTEPPLTLTDGGIAKTFGCYDYQSCEHPGYDASESRALVEKIERAFDGVEYDPNVPWGWDD